jgi:hypothetical protein
MWAKNEARNVEAEPPAPRHLYHLPKSETLFGMMNLANFNMLYTCVLQQEEQGWNSQVQAYCTEACDNLRSGIRNAAPAQNTMLHNETLQSVNRH